ncbi:RabGAP/TBC [Hesseltinella vesiculosa]|uniref:RabGAP/TBC n=1 Tax=Hesseltinella vesiculosa TaxID=101127 RepID=A0A1X2G871_9FUNG|nr:RabGAP/TBC [Hesseltinella vesiculosa]
MTITPPTPSTSKLYSALQQQQQQAQNHLDNSNGIHAPVSPRPLPSKSYQPRRSRLTSFGPTPTRNPSMTLAQWRKQPSDVKVLPRLEEENASLPPQSTELILAQIDRQNAMLDSDPKSISISSNGLKAHLSTLQTLVDGPKEEEIDWEFWSALIDDYPSTTLKLPHLVSAKLRAGIPQKVRGLIWQAMSQSASLNLETVYGQLLQEPSPYTRIIQRDLARTFPGVEMFKQEGGEGQNAMEHVLTAYSLYDSLVGYCQGLAFLVGPLLMNMPEQQAFCVFVRLMETYEMRTMFTLNMEGLQLRLYQFTSFFSQLLPELADHLAMHAVNPPMYASQWFLTLFAYTFPIPLVLRIYDIVFAEGAAETIMRVSIAMLRRSQEALLQLTEFEDILDYVTSKLYNPYDDEPGQVIQDAMNLSGVITAEKMDQLADLYCQELEQEKKQNEQMMAARFNVWSNQQEHGNEKKKKKRDSIGWLKKKDSSPKDAQPQLQLSPLPQQPSSANASPPLSSSSIAGGQDVAILHQQIEELLMALSQMQKDCLQVKQELVQVRMDKMDLEAECDHLRMSVEEYEERMLAKDHDGLVKQLHNENKALHQRLKDAEGVHDQNQQVLVERLVELQNKCEAIETDKLQVSKDLQHTLQRQKDSEHMARELQFEKIRLIHELDAEKQKHAQTAAAAAAAAAASTPMTRIASNGSAKSQQRNTKPHRATRPYSVVVDTQSAPYEEPSLPRHSTSSSQDKRHSFYGRLLSALSSPTSEQPQDPTPV